MFNFLKDKALANDLGFEDAENPVDKETKALDIVVVRSPDKDSRLVKEETLAVNEIQQWLARRDEACQNDPNRVAGLRMINIKSIHQKKHRLTLRLTLVVFQAILEHFKVPTTFPYILAVPRPWCSVHTATIDGQSQLSFLLRSINDDGDAALALTFEIRTMTTHIVVFWENVEPRGNNMFEEISREIQDRVDLADHPALCLIVIAFCDYAWLRSESIILQENLDSLRTEIQEKVHDPDRSASIERTRSFYDDIENLKRGLDDITFSTATAVGSVKFYLLRYKSILEFIQAVDEVISKLQSKIDFEPFRQKGIELRCHAQSLINSLNIQLYFYEEVEKRIAVMSNILRMLALDGKRCLVYKTRLILRPLPLQTLFAMPLFNWNASRISDVASPHAWLYLAAALPLTLVITTCWFIWLRWNRWVRQRQAREEALELGFTDEETREEKAIEGPKDMRPIEAKPLSILKKKGKRATLDTD